MPYLKAEAERMAINMPIQGTQADIIKLAMIRLHERYPELRMLLQVHDELVFEVGAKEAVRVAKDIRSVMEETVTLKVPIDVEVEVGQSWGSLEPIEA